jgi:hypothetical protein
MLFQGRLRFARYGHLCLYYMCKLLPLDLDWTWIFHHMMYTTPYMESYYVDVCKTSNIVNIW